MSRLPSIASTGMSLPALSSHGHGAHHPPDLPQLDPALAAELPELPDPPRFPSPSHSASSASLHFSRIKKTRREKPHIELAPDQPLTTQGRPRARVYVACLQCRTRKIRCDGAKPACHNCTRRARLTEDCVYDAAPKRRGPDKTPGARQRTSREVRQENSTDAAAPRHPRRKRHSTASPPPQLQFPPFPVAALPLPPPKQPSIVLDPQLADMPPFHSTPAASPQPVRPGSSLFASGSAISDPLPLDGTSHHMTSSQVLT